MSSKDRVQCQPRTDEALPNWSWDCPKARKHVIVFHHKGAEFITYVPCDRAPTPDEVETLTQEFESLINEYWTGEMTDDGDIDDQVIEELIYYPIDGLGIKTTTWCRTPEQEQAREGVLIKLDGTITGPDNDLPRTTITL